MKKIFGGINLSYKVVIISAILIGLFVGGCNCIPALKDTTLTDFAIYFDFWILCGIFIIMNSKSNMDSALKCFIFFLISQPLIYLVEVPFTYMGWGIFIYYKFWFIMTILCFPMGYLGYYMKKDRWYGLLILTPIIILLTSNLQATIHGLLYMFPHHLINLLLILSTAIIYPLVIFNNKKIKYIGLAISIICIAIFGLLSFKSDYSYATNIRCRSDDFYFNDKYKVSLADEKIGEVSIDYLDSVGDYCINAKFKTEGNTKLIVEDENGNKNEYDLSVGKNTYNLNLNNE